MQLKISKSQKTGMMGGGKLTMMAKIVPTDAEAATIKKFAMQKEIVWVQDPATTIAPKFMGVKAMTVGSLINGETHTCKDIGEMLQMEAYITKVSQGLKTMVDAAAEFGGDVVIDL